MLGIASTREMDGGMPGFNFGGDAGWLAGWIDKFCGVGLLVCLQARAGF